MFAAARLPIHITPIIELPSPSHLSSPSESETEKSNTPGETEREKRSRKKVCAGAHWVPANPLIRSPPLLARIYISTPPFSQRSSLKEFVTLSCLQTEPGARTLPLCRIHRAGMRRVGSCEQRGYGTADAWRFNELIRRSVRWWCWNWSGSEVVE